MWASLAHCSWLGSTSCQWYYVKPQPRQQKHLQISPNIPWKENAPKQCRAITKIARGSACNLYKLFDGHVEFAVLWLAFRSCSNTSSPFERGLAYVYEVCGEGDAYTEARGRHQVTTSISRSSEVRFIPGLEGGVFH